MKRVLFLCTGNSARSQMAEGLLRHMAGDRFEAFSAGTHPAGLNPLSVQVMREIGIDISKHTSKAIAHSSTSTLILSSPCAIGPKRRARSFHLPHRPCTGALMILPRQMVRLRNACVRFDESGTRLPIGSNVYRGRIKR
ncbi:MAG TPA: arsenate reductase ArsC [Nitrospiraceae bacterium]|nr:arsenate reductase ArsC [Nitrospiraceae bacterium]